MKRPTPTQAKHRRIAVASVAVGLGATGFGALGSLHSKADASSPVVQCDVPMDGGINGTREKIEGQGIDTSNARIVGPDGHDFTDGFGRGVAVDGSPLVRDGIDVIRVSASDQACAAIGHVAVQPKQ